MGTKFPDYDAKALIAEIEREAETTEGMIDANLIFRCLTHTVPAIKDRKVGADFAYTPEQMQDHIAVIMGAIHDPRTGGVRANWRERLEPALAVAR